MKTKLKMTVKWIVLITTLSYNTGYSQFLLNDTIKIAIYTNDPRKEILNNIEKGRTDLLLLQAGQLHGHFCPGLAMGVMGACYAMNKMKTDSISLEGLKVIIETGSCVSDGVEFVTGCSIGKGSLFYKDLGKTAFTIVNKDGKGIRMCAKHESPDIIKASFPAFQDYYQKVVIEKSTDPEMIANYKKASFDRNFKTLSIPIDQLFTIQDIQLEIPEKNGKDESVVCSVCGESVRKSKTTEINGKIVCTTCSNNSYGILDNHGIHCK
jgi:formylmethanofuran dehydrogenase subunit E